MLHLYAIVDRPEAPLPDLAVPSLTVVTGPAAALVAGRIDGPVATTATAIQDHGAVIEALMADRAVLPVRFGSRVPDARSAMALLVDNRSAIAACLSDVAGCVEIGLHLAPACSDETPTTAGCVAPRATPAASGRDHLESKRRETAVRRSRRAGFEATVSRIHDHLARATRRARRAADAGDVADLAFLVAADRLPTFLAAVRSLRGQCRDVVMVCTGPWPAYSFVDLDLTASLERRTDDG